MFSLILLTTRAEALAAAPMDLRRSERDLLLSDDLDQADTAEDEFSIDLPEVQRRSFHRTRRQGLSESSSSDDDGDEAIPFDDEPGDFDDEDMDVDSNDSDDEDGEFRRFELEEPRRFGIPAGIVGTSVYTLARRQMARYAARTGIRMSCSKSPHCQSWLNRMGGVVRRYCGGFRVCSRVAWYVNYWNNRANAWVDRWARTECNRNWVCKRLLSGLQKTANNVVKTGSNAVKTVTNTAKKAVNTFKKTGKDIGKTFKKWGRRRAEVVMASDSDSQVEQRLAARRAARVE